MQGWTEELPDPEGESTFALWKGNSTCVDGEWSEKESEQGHGCGRRSFSLKVISEVTKLFFLRAVAASLDFHEGISQAKM